MLQRLLQRLLTGTERLAHAAVWVGGALMIGASVLVTVDVLLRKFMATSLGGADEISGYLFAIATAWAFSYALLHRVNVRIDALYLLLPGPVKAVLDVFGLLLLSGFIGILTWRAVLLLLDTYANWSRSITPLQTPLAIPQTLWVMGLLLFSFTLALVLVAGIWALVRGDLLAVQKLAGVRTLDEEVKEETRGTDRAGLGS